MQSPCLKAAEQVFLYSCCTKSVLGEPGGHDEPAKTSPKSRSTAANCRQGFAKITTSSLFPNTWFTDPESLPSFQESFSQFKKAYPQFSETTRIDQLRAQEYYHLSLSNHICLDYIGIGLFSHWQVQPQYSSALSIPSSSSSPPQNSDSPCFSAAYKSVNLKSQLLHGGQGSDLESIIKKRIMEFLNVSQNDYSMVFTANKSSAFKLLAESYPFQSSKKLLTVYDYESEALQTMVNTSERRGAKVMSADFKWPRLRVHAARLKKLIIRKKKKKKPRGLFVFPLQSRMTGTSYSYQWMSMAQENGWHVLLDGCALGPKDMDSFGLSLFRPDFLVCSFYKIFGENPTGFGCLFVKKSTLPILEASTSTGIVSLVPTKRVSGLLEDSSGTDAELEIASACQTKEDKRDTLSLPSLSQHIQSAKSTETNTSGTDFSTKEGSVAYPGEEKTEKAIVLHDKRNLKHHENGAQMECRCLDHVDSLGLMLISSRGRYLINWLVSALMKLQHPNRLDNFPMVRIYGPKIKFDRGPALAFNIYDWKAEKVEPVLVQKLADRNNISLGTGFLHNIWFADKYEVEKEKILEKKEIEENQTRKSKNRKADQGITVVTVAINFLANFEDIYRLWIFIARFLDADFVEKERWRYTALNQKTVEV